jgi:polyisoprenoid-binding protein YceI
LGDFVGAHGINGCKGLNRPEARCTKNHYSISYNLMKSFIKTLTLISIFSLSGLLQLNAQEVPMWMLDKDHTSLNSTIKHFFSDVQGRFNDFIGMVHFDPKNTKGSKVNFSIPISSINTNNIKRDDHLKSPDFFNAAKFPEMKFKSTKFEKKGLMNLL